MGATGPQDVIVVGVRIAFRRRTTIVAAVLAVAVVAVTASWTVLGDEDRAYRRGPVTILTGATLGIYFAYGVELASVVNARLDGVSATAVPTTASVENLQRVAREPNVFAFAAADAASAAVDGRAPFDRPLPVRALARVYDDYIHLIVRDESPVHTIGGLRGLKVSVGSDGSGTELIASRLLDVAGVDPAELTVSHLGINESVAALRDGEVDAFFWSGGLPTSGVSELAGQVPIRLVPLGELADVLHDRWDTAYRRGTIPADTYRQADETATIAVPDLLVTRADTDPGLGYEITKALFDARNELTLAVPVAGALDRRVAIATSPVPLHDGALSYYRDVKA